MDLLTLLKELIEIDSSTIEGANQAVMYCGAYLEKNNIETSIHTYENKKCLTARVGSGRETIVLNGHVDVVSAGANQFKPYEKDGRLYGRGSADMKGGVAVMLDVMASLKEGGCDKSILLQIVSDEEVGGHLGTKMLVADGYVGDFVICTEPTQLHMSTMAKGILQLDVLTKGIAAHGSRPWLGENAIIKGLENYKAIENLPILKEGNELFDGSSINLSFSHGGDIYNRVPEDHLIGIDIRYVPHLNPEKIVDAIKEVIDGEVKVKFMEPGIHVSKDHPYIHDLEQALEAVTGSNEHILFGQHGSSDVRFFSTRNIPAVELGPVGGNWHGEDEYVDIGSLVTLKETILNFAKMKGRNL